MSRARAAVLLLLALAAGRAFLAPRAAAQTQGSGRTHIREGNDLYDRKQFSDAEISYRKALEAADEPVRAKFNLGDALYQQERYDEAAGQYEGAASSAEEATVRAQAFHNLGNALLKGRKLQESIEAYKQALKLDPKDEDTRYNLEYARRLLQQQQQQQQQQEQDRKDDKQQEKKDEEKDKPQDEKQEGRDRRQPQDPGEQERQEKDAKRQPRQPKDQISKADAERILEALKQQEQDVKKKLQKKVPVRVKVEKDW